MFMEHATWYFHSGSKLQKRIRATLRVLFLGGHMKKKPEFLRLKSEFLRKKVRISEIKVRISEKKVRISEKKT